jgi:hypothetical protein
VHKRALLLPADQLIDDALDPYIFVRDAYLQRRLCEIKKTCPCADIPDEATTTVTSAASKNNGDTFVAADGNDASGKGTNSKPSSKPAAKTTSAGGDTFVEP